jgi:hypothetical protein
MKTTGSIGSAYESLACNGAGHRRRTRQARRESHPPHAPGCCRSPPVRPCRTRWRQGRDQNDQSMTNDIERGEPYRFPTSLRGRDICDRRDVVPVDAVAKAERESRQHQPEVKSLLGIAHHYSLDHGASDSCASSSGDGDGHAASFESPRPGLDPPSAVTRSFPAPWPIRAAYTLLPV